MIKVTYYVRYSALTFQDSTMPIEVISAICFLCRGGQICFHLHLFQRNTIALRWSLIECLCLNNHHRQIHLCRREVCAVDCEIENFCRLLIALALKPTFLSFLGLELLINMTVCMNHTLHRQGCLLNMRMASLFERFLQLTPCQ